VGARLPTPNRAPGLADPSVLSCHRTPMSGMIPATLERPFLNLVGDHMMGRRLLQDRRPLEMSARIRSSSREKTMPQAPCQPLSSWLAPHDVRQASLRPGWAAAIRGTDSVLEGGVPRGRTLGAVAVLAARAITGRVANSFFRGRFSSPEGAQPCVNPKSGTAERLRDFRSERAAVRGG